MPVNPRFLAARAAEQRNRLMAYMPNPQPLCGVEINHLTPRAVAELAISGNAFVCGGSLDRADVFQFVWRLHPLFCRPRRDVSKLRPGLLKDVLAFGVRAGVARYHCGRAIAAMAEHAAIHAVESYLVDVYQDGPGGDASDGDGRGRNVRSAVRPPRFWLDNYCMQFSRLIPGFLPALIADTPLALLHQLHREHLLSQPEGELEVFAPSDGLL